LAGLENHKPVLLIYADDVAIVKERECRTLIKCASPAWVYIMGGWARVFPGFDVGTPMQKSKLPKRSILVIVIFVISTWVLEICSIVPQIFKKIPLRIHEKPFQVKNHFSQTPPRWTHSHPNQAFWICICVSQDSNRNLPESERDECLCSPGAVNPTATYAGA